MDTTDTAKFTRADYMRLPEGFPAFLLRGELVREAAPTWGHQAFVQGIAMRLERVARA